MPIAKGTDANNPSDSIIEIITKFNLEKKFLGFAYDGGAYLNNFSDIIYSELDHTTVFTPNKTLFVMEFLAHEIAGECKAGVVDVQYEDGSLDTSSTREKCYHVEKEITKRCHSSYPDT